MNRFNRKKLLGEFEFIRQGFDTAVRRSCEYNDEMSIIS